MHTGRWQVPLLLLIQVASACAQDQPRGHALLVGVTRYDNLPEEIWLSGPANDVVLMRSMLRDRFGFDDRNIVTLSEGSDKALRPTRANILRELDGLLGRVRDGDQVVVHFSGHGSLAPHRPDPQDLNPAPWDGLFLPADIGKWDGEKKHVANSIDDRTFARWIRQLMAARRNVSLWFITDACHSGGIAREKARGAQHEVERAIAPEQLGIPAELAAAAAAAQAQSSQRSRGAAEPDGAVRLATDLPRVAAVYACRSTEKTVEGPYARPDPNADPLDPRFRYGLFTYTFCGVLNRFSGRLTYNELLHRVRLEYDNRGRIAPIPLVEGSARDTEILGSIVRRSDFRLTVDGDGLAVNAGRLAGFNKGTIFAVFAPPGFAAPGAAPLGHVVVESADVLRARVRPCAHAALPEPSADVLKAGSVCRPVYIDFNIEPLRVYLDASTEAAITLRAKLESMASSRTRMFQLVSNPSAAHFEISRAAPDQPVTLTDPTSGQAFVAGTGAGWDQTLLETIQRIARARNLLHLAGLNGLAHDDGHNPPIVSVELQVQHGSGYRAADSTNGITLRDGQRVKFRLVNSGKQPVDMTLLFIDSGYGIHPLFPHASTSDENRVEPGGAREIVVKVNADTQGAERVVLIATSARGASMDFSFLAQSTLEQARGTARGGDALSSPLGQLLRSMQDHEGNTRGLDVPQVNDYTVRSLGWQTVAR
jgi:hypothetical protein